MKLSFFRETLNSNNVSLHQGNIRYQQTIRESLLDTRITSRRAWWYSWPPCATETQINYGSIGSLAHRLIGWICFSFEHMWKKDLRFLHLFSHKRGFHVISWIHTLLVSKWSPLMAKWGSYFMPSIPLGYLRLKEYSRNYYLYMAQLLTKMRLVRCIYFISGFKSRWEISIRTNFCI